VCTYSIAPIIHLAIDPQKSEQYPPSHGIYSREVIRAQSSLTRVKSEAVPTQCIHFILAVRGGSLEKTTSTTATTPLRRAGPSSLTAHDHYAVSCRLGALRARREPGPGPQRSQLLLNTKSNGAPSQIGGSTDAGGYELRTTRLLHDLRSGAGALVHAKMALSRLPKAPFLANLTGSRTPTLRGGQRSHLPRRTRRPPRLGRDGNAERPD
jgi:hypothetical protein